MAVQNPPIFLADQSHPAEGFRRMFGALLGHRQGIVSPSALEVTQRPTPAMAVDVATGDAFILGTLGTYQGSYYVENRGTTTLVVQPPDALPRIDRVVARVVDKQYAPGEPASLWALEVVKGAPNASPVAPALPANALDLAWVAVAPGDLSVVTSAITDKRFGALQGTAAALGGVVVCTSTTRPSTGLYNGMPIFETDTGQRRTYYNGAWAPEAGTRLATDTAALVTITSTGPTVLDLGVTFDAIAGRRYSVVLRADSDCTALSLVRYDIRHDSTGGATLVECRQRLAATAADGRDSREWSTDWVASSTGSKQFHVVGRSEVGGGGRCVSASLSVYDAGR